MWVGKTYIGGKRVKSNCSRGCGLSGSPSNVWDDGGLDAMITSKSQELGHYTKRIAKTRQKERKVTNEIRHCLQVWEKERNVDDKSVPSHIDAGYKQNGDEDRLHKRYEMME
jgi:hypothetical protein